MTMKERLGKMVAMAAVGVLAIYSAPIMNAEGVVRSPESIDLRGIEVDSRAGLVTLRWGSRAGSLYAIDEMGDSEGGWRESLWDIEGNEGETVITWSLGSGQDVPKARFFRVREVGIVALAEEPLEALAQDVPTGQEPAAEQATISEEDGLSAAVTTLAPARTESSRAADESDKALTLIFAHQPLFSLR